MNHFRTIYQVKYIITSLFLLALILFSCQEMKPYYLNIQPDKTFNRTRKNSKAATERMIFDRLKLINPHTKTIPENMRKKEIDFSKTILPSELRNTHLETTSGMVYEKVYTTNWQLEGPKNIGGRTRALAIDITNPDIVIAGGVTGGIYRSTDGGATWERAISAKNFLSVVSIAQDPRIEKQNIWYYTTGEIIHPSPIPSFGSSSLVGDGVFKSLDSGKTWSVLENTVINAPQEQIHPFQASTRVVVDPTNGNVFVATYYGIYLSEDEGKTWKKVVGADEKAIYDIAVTSDGTLFVTEGGDVNRKSYNSKIYTSTDGKNWTILVETYIRPNPLLNIVGELFSFFVSKIAYSKSDENSIYFLLDLSQKYISYIPLLFVYDRQENQWSLRYSPGLKVKGIWEEEHKKFYTQGGYNLSLAVHPLERDIVYLGGIDLFRSTDGFKTDKNLKHIGGYDPKDDNKIYPNHHPDIHTIKLAEKDEKVWVYTGSDGGVHKYKETLQEAIDWTDLNKSYITTQFYGISIDKNNVSNSYILGGMQDNGAAISNPRTGEWQEVVLGDGGFSGFSQKGLKEFYTSTQFGKVFQTTYDETSERYNTKKCYNGSLGQIDFEFIAPFTINPQSDGSILYLGKKSTLMINDNPTTDFLCQSNWVNAFRSLEGKITTIETIKKNPEKLIIGTDKGVLYFLENAKSSSMTSTKTVAPNNGNRGLGYYISDISVNPTYPEEILVTFSNYGIPSIFLSRNSGDTWEDMSGNLEEFQDGSGNGPAVFSAEIVPINPTTSLYLVGTSTGIYSKFSNNDNDDWYSEGQKYIKYGNVTDIEFREADSWLVASTFGNGVYSANVSISQKLKQFLAISDYSFGLLNQTNFLRDYKKELEMGLILNENKKNVSIYIVNTQGARVKEVLQNQNLAVGNYYEHPIKVEVNDFPQGVYFAVLSIDNRIISKKFAIF